MTKRDEQLGLEQYLVTTFGEKNRLRIRNAIEGNTLALEGTVTEEWRREFARRVLIELSRRSQGSEAESEESPDECFQAEMAGRAARSKVREQHSSVSESQFQTAAEPGDDKELSSPTTRLKGVSVQENSEETAGSGPNHRQIKGDVGPQLMNFVHEQMQIDAGWSLRGERDLTWWGHRLAQRIWAETVLVEDGDDIVRVHAETDVLRNVAASEQIARTLSVLNRNASLSAYIWDSQRGKISLRSSAYFHSENVPWLSRFFLSAISLQAAEAHLQPDALAKLVGGEVDESAHPQNGFREAKDEMLDVIRLLFGPEGRNPSRFTSEDFHAVMRLDPAPWVMANESEKGLTAEFPFAGCMPPTALLTVDNEIRNPLLGSGLLILLRLPLTLSETDVDTVACQLNLAELKSPTRSHFMGSWCVDSERNVNLMQRGLLLSGQSVPTGFLEKQAKGTLSFCSFIPSASYRRGLLEVIIYSMAHRARWANQYLASEEGVPREFGPRHPSAFQEQRDQHFSIIKKVFNRALDQRKKKPS